MSEVFFYSYIRSNQKIYSYNFEWNVKATLNLLAYQILNLQGESYKIGIQAGPTIHIFLFYFSLHFHENALLLSSLIARRWVGLQTLWRFRLKDISIDESFSLLYLLFISWFICSRRWCMDKLGVFHANQNLCVLIHIWTKVEVGAVKPV